MAAQHSLDQLPSLVPNPQGPAMATGDQRIAALEADQRLEHQRRHRIGHRDETQNHAHRSGDFRYLLLFVLVHDSHAWLPGERAVDAPAEELDLAYLVLDDAHAGLLHRCPGQFLRVVGNRLDAIPEQCIHPLFRPCLECLLSRHRPGHHLLHNRYAWLDGHTAGHLLGQSMQPGCKTLA